MVQLSHPYMTAGAAIALTRQPFVSKVLWSLLRFTGLLGLPWWLKCKQSTCSAGNLVLMPLLGRSPVEGNAAHSSVLAWRTLWTEKPGGLQSVGSQGVRLLGF